MKKYWHVFTTCLTPGATGRHEISLDDQDEAWFEADDLRDAGLRGKVLRGPGAHDWIMAKVAELNGEQP